MSKRSLALLVGAVVVALELGLGAAVGFRQLWPTLTADRITCVLVLVSLLIAVPLCPLGAGVDRLLDALARFRLIWLVLPIGVVVVLSIGTILVTGTTPGSPDELVPLWQSAHFSHLELVARYSPGLLDAAMPRALQQTFVLVSSDARAVSVYFPGWALAMTPFTGVGAPWLLGPVMAGLAITMIGRVAVQLTDTRTALLALVFTVASGTFLLTGMTLYPATGNLAVAMLWVWLILRDRPRWDFVAGLAGGLALNFNNQVPHAAFVLPWVLWLLAGQSRRRRLLPLAAGYLPGILLTVGWYLVQRGVPTPGLEQHGDFWLSKLHELVGIPTVYSLTARLLDLCSVWTWSTPGLLLFAWLGWRRAEGNTPLRLLGLSFATTVLAYVFFPLDQGLGYGARYYHVAWGALPILAAYGLRLPDGERTRHFALAAACVGLIVVLPLQLLFGRAANNNRTEPIQALAGPGVNLVFVDFEKIPYPQIVLADDLAGGPSTLIVLASQGDAADRNLVAQYFPGARLIDENETGSGWARPAP